MRDYLCRLLLFAHCLSFVITSLVKLVGQLDAHEFFSPSFSDFHSYVCRTYAHDLFFQLSFSFGF